MTLDKQITDILLSNVEFGAKDKTVWVSKIVPQLKRLIKEAELKAYKRGRHHGHTKLVLDLEWGQTTMKEEIKKLEFPIDNVILKGL